MTMPRWSIFRKGMILLGLPLAFQLAMFAYLFKVHADVAEAELWEIHSKHVLEQADAIRLGLTEGHSALRGMYALQSTEFEKEQRAEVRGLPEQIRKLREKVADDPLQQVRLDRLQEQVRLYLEWVTQMEQLAQAGVWAEYDARLQARQGILQVTAVDDQLVQFRQTEEQLDADRLIRAEQSREKQRRALAVAGSTTLLLALGLTGAFAISIGRRLAIATENARCMAEGRSLAAPVQGTDEIARLDAVLHDTARRLVEASIKEKQYTEELQRRSVELEQINAELMYKNQENETFVYSVSHDLRSPLVNLQGFTKELSYGAEALREVLSGVELPEAVRKRIDMVVEEDLVTSSRFIQAAVTRSANIINSLLQLSRAGRVEYQKQPVDLNLIVERIVTSMRVSLEEKHAKVVARPLPTVLADPAAIEQVLANLIGNAVNYLDSTRPGRIEIGAARSADDDEQVTVYVKDNGLGIPAAYLSKLFVAFQRLHGEVAEGEGIGLALVKRIVDRHGGRVWVESTEGVGSAFYVALPKVNNVAIAKSPVAAGEGRRS